MLILAWQNISIFITVGTVADITVILAYVSAISLIIKFAHFQ